MALETRLGERARVSVDLDADHVHGVEAARADLQRAAVEDLGDYFGFAIAGSEELREAGVGLAVRYKLESSLSGRPFEPLQVDVSISVPDPWDAQSARRPGLLSTLGYRQGIGRSAGHRPGHFALAALAEFLIGVSGYAASRGCTSRLILSAEARVATSRSYAACRFIQNCGVMSK